MSSNNRRPFARRKPPRAERSLRQRAENCYRNFQAIERQFSHHLDDFDAEAKMPENPSDPLAFMGSLKSLNMSTEEEEYARESTQSLINQIGAEAVWKSRGRLKMELAYVLSLLF